MPSGLRISYFLICWVLAALYSGALLPRIQGKPLQVKPGCRYEGRRYQEGAIVATSEPCLQCRCVEASLRCRLRVCPRIPNPPPPECHLRVSSEHVCCSEMICGESHESENSLRRVDLGIDDVVEEDGCLFEGVRYGAGSAMIATRRCEYCYCILNARRCVRPKCLLPLPGCTPLYAPHSCCPVAYNCTHDRNGLETSTTTKAMSLNGCRVGNRIYDEGEMVRDIAWKAPCDNCFCAMGAIRCVPLACAPPLQGCSPIVREGQCCPSTYNCSGSIEVKATQNFASYAFVSKDYANFRKETHFYPVDNQLNPILSNAIVEGRGHRIIDGTAYTTDQEVIDVTTPPRPSSIPQDSTPEFSTPCIESSSMSTLESETMGNEILSDADSEGLKSTLLMSATTSLTTPMSTEVTTNTELSTSTRESTTLELTTFESTGATWTTQEETTTVDTGSTTGESGSTTMEGEPLEERVNGAVREEESVTTERAISQTTTFSNSSITIIQPTEASREEEKEEKGEGDEIAEEKGSTLNGAESATSLPTTILMPDDIFVMNVTLKTNVSVGHVEGMTVAPVRSIPPDVEAILNITQREKGEDYDYYSEPTLPPSLPNVRIIPFVAADALVKNEKDTTSSVTAYPSGSAAVIPAELQRPTDSSNFYDIVTRENRFSPPVETEGGFVPRDPPYFEASYHSTDLSLEIGTGVTVVPADITNPNRKEEGPLQTNCRFETRQYRHGEFIPNSGLCVICMCYYGEVVCSDEKCPPLKIGCRRVNEDERCCGKVICVDTAESPTMVLDRADATAPSQRQGVTSLDGIATPDPFRDVIKTEPAPDLPSLIEDMIPYLVERGISTPRPTTPMQSNGLKSSPTIQKSEFVGVEIPIIHAPLYTYQDQIDRRKDEDIVVTGSPISAPIDDGMGYNFHPAGGNSNFSPFSHREPSENFDAGFSEFIYDKPIESIVTQNFSNPGNSVSVGNSNVTEDGPPSAEPNFLNKTENTSLKPSETGPNDKTSDTVYSPEPEEKPEDSDDSGYSFGSVFNLLFSDPTTEKPEIQIPLKKNNSTISIGDPTISSSPVTTDSFPTSTEVSSTFDLPSKFTSAQTIEHSSPAPVVKSTTTTKPIKQGFETAVGGLLKLAGCNIYGRMYRVGKIITELSGPCLECRCTEIGVQCKKLLC